MGRTTQVETPAGRDADEVVDAMNRMGADSVNPATTHQLATALGRSTDWVRRGLGTADSQKKVRSYQAEHWVLHADHRSPGTWGKGMDYQSRDATIVFEVRQINPAHAHLDVWVGRDPDSRGRAGSLAFRAGELAELLGMDPDQLIRGANFEIEMRMSE